MCVSDRVVSCARHGFVVGRPGVLVVKGSVHNSAINHAGTNFFLIRGNIQCYISSLQWY
jgi:hypothetical protein